MTTSLSTAANSSLVSCHSCHLLCQNSRTDPDGQAICPRCGAALHRRKPNSIARTWALVLTAFVLYIPANILPVMTVVSFGKAQSDTIMGGVIYFVISGSWYLALIIFIASVVVPLMKLFILTFLLISIHLKSHWRPKDRTRLYRITEVVGRWSMVDIYVVTVMVALVQAGSLATIKAGPGAIAFAAVVIVTMFAAISFDPRLIWDAMETQDD